MRASTLPIAWSIKLYVVTLYLVWLHHGRWMADGREQTISIKIMKCRTYTVQTKQKMSAKYHFSVFTFSTSVSVCGAKLLLVRVESRNNE
jgi:hypothetical protein